MNRRQDIDDPRTTEFRRELIARKGFLREMYTEWYEYISSHLPDSPGRVLELGSGAGFMREVIPEAETSEVFPCKGVMHIISGQALPFGDGELRAIVMTGVLHHIPSVREFLNEAVRCLRVGGAIVMIEPWLTQWSRLIYTHLHHEPFLPDTETWEFAGTGPLSGANGALPWILFVRDRDTFSQQYPLLRIERIDPMMPVSYLLSGGMSRPAFAPRSAFRWVRRFERLLGRFNRFTAMFAGIVVRRVDLSDPAS